MATNIADKIRELKTELPAGVELVAVSKTRPAEDILQAHAAGQLVFGESRPQEMTAKHDVLPGDIRWHMIGHLQTNKVSQIIPYVTMIHSVDSSRLLETIDREAVKFGRVVDLLLEVRIAREESKHGWREEELTAYLATGAYRSMKGVRFRGLMGIATFTEDQETIRNEFVRLKRLFDHLQRAYFGPGFDTLSMGMTHDYKLAVTCGSTMVRIGSHIFGTRE